MYEIANRLGFRIKLDDVAQATLGAGRPVTDCRPLNFGKTASWTNCAIIACKT